METSMRAAVDADLPAIHELVMAAFGPGEGPEIVRLIDALLIDPSASPVLSLVAVLDDHLVGHILYTRARLKEVDPPVSAALLAPLAVHPRHQSCGIGRRLVTEGLAALARSGVDLVFVLGHPAYYPRFGFEEAGVRGFRAPYPIEPRNAAAWRVRELKPGAIASYAGEVGCADALDRPEYWCE